MSTPDQPMQHPAALITPQPQLHICLLGRFQVLRDGIPLAIRSGSKSEALLVALALRYREAQTREQLMTVLWPESAPALSSQSLHSLVYSTNKHLSSDLGMPVVVLCEGRYRLNMNSRITLDVADFDYWATLGDHQRHCGDTAQAALSYNHALRRYVGDLYQASDAYFLVERERLRMRYQALLNHQAEHAFAAGNYAHCQEFVWKLLEQDPCREDAHRLLMRCYVRLGQRASALRQYQHCLTILRSELDIAPEPSTITLFEQIRRYPEHV